MSDVLPIIYNIVIEGPTGVTVIDWGNAPNWVEENSKKLDSATVLALTPKRPGTGIAVKVILPEDARWIVFSRVFGQIWGPQAGKRVRLYAIGWQMTVGGRNIKSINWVYPNGIVENAEEPELIEHAFSA